MTHTEQTILDILSKHRVIYKAGAINPPTIRCTCGANVLLGRDLPGAAHLRHVAFELAKTSVWSHVVVYTPAGE